MQFKAKGGNNIVSILTMKWFMITALSCVVSISSGFSSIRAHNRHVVSAAPEKRAHTSSSALSVTPTEIDLPPLLSSEDATLAFWVISFASSHIGMSATRTAIIQYLGKLADEDMKLVGRPWTLPAWWPADGSGGNRFFPDPDTAGRQLYRAGYTAVSFITLGSAFGAYLHSSGMSQGEVLNVWGDDNSMLLSKACLGTAALSLGASIGSLFNASPLGLMPAFEAAPNTSDSDATKMSNINSKAPGDTLAGLRRDDSLKFTPRGFTRITRHPLILPVFPWGFASAYLAGSRVCDYLLFVGLSLYAVAGCAAQDLRVLREEGSVGTVFQPIESLDEGQNLRSFFDMTSFVPFLAVVHRNRTWRQAKRSSLIEKKSGRKSRTDVSAHFLFNYMRAIKRAYEPFMDLDTILDLIEAAYERNKGFVLVCKKDERNSGDLWETRHGSDEALETGKP